MLIDGPNRPDLLLATGDITDRGDADSYRRLATAFSRCPFPVWPSVGNHDVRDNFHAQFPGFDDGNGFVQYAIDLPAVRLVTIDTLEEGRHGGAFCDARAAWLDAELGRDTAKPTYIVMHHPPVESGIEWMNTHPDEPWVHRFTDVVRGHPQMFNNLVSNPPVAPATFDLANLRDNLRAVTAQPGVGVGVRWVAKQINNGRYVIHGVSASTHQHAMLVVDNTHKLVTGYPGQNMGGLGQAPVKIREW